MVQKEFIESIKLESSKLLSDVKVSEIERAKLLQSIEDNEQRIAEGKEEISQLKMTMDTKNKSLSDLDGKCKELNKDIECLALKLSTEIESHAKTSEHLEKELLASNNLRDSAEANLKEANINTEDLKRKYNDEKERAHEKINVLRISNSIRARSTRNKPT